MAREYQILYGGLSVASIAAGTGVYTLLALPEQLKDWIKAGIMITIRGCASGANNGTFTVLSVSGNAITTDNSASVLDASSSGKAYYPVGGTSDNVLTDLVTHSIDYVTASVQMRFEVADQTESTYANKLAAAESVFRTPRMDLVWLNGSTEIMAFRHSDATGFDAEPTIEKREDKASNRARIYTVSIRFGLPADVVHAGGRRDSTVNVAYSPSRRRTVTVAGIYTAVPPASLTARGQYEANISAYCTAVLAALGGTFELAEEPRTEANDTNRTLSFTRVYDEIVFGQGGGVNDSAIVRQNVRVTRSRVAPGDTPVAERLATLVADFTCWIDSTVTTDLEGKYESIKSWLVNLAAATMSGGSAALVEESPSFDFDDNRISARLTILVATNSVIEQRITTEIVQDYGVVLVPVANGDPLGRYDYQGPARHLKRTIVQKRELGGSGGGGGGGGGSGGSSVGLNADLVGTDYAGAFVGLGGQINIFGGSWTGADYSNFVNLIMGNAAGGSGGGGTGGVGNNGGWTPIRHTRRTTPLRLGLDGYTIDVTDVEDVLEFERFNSVRGGGGGGGGNVAT
jgi:hypothetical protein